jgi:hypothetical protein
LAIPNQLPPHRWRSNAHMIADVATRIATTRRLNGNTKRDTERATDLLQTGLLVFRKTK